MVEDDPLIVSFLAKGLTAHGFSVDEVTTGAAAIDRLARGGIDVMLLDLGLPDIDGMELMRLLNEQGTSVPTIVITARTHPRDRLAALDRGARGYVTKPFVLTTVVDALRTWLPHGPPR
jgi:DNA-binding response OmpR family regulator